jgi:hypothetical protein
LKASTIFISNDPTLFLHFCDYLPFEEELAVHLYNFKFPIHENDLIDTGMPGLGEFFFPK